MGDFRMTGEALTRAQYMALMEGRERPLTEPSIRRRPNKGEVVITVTPPPSGGSRKK